MTARARTVPADVDRCVPGGVGLVAGGEQVVVEVERPVGEEPFLADDHGVAVDDPWTPSPSMLANDSTGASVMPRADGAGGDGAGDRVLGGVLERPGEEQDLVGRGVVPVVHDVDERHAPVVIVPVLSSTTVSTLRVDSRISGPLIRTPSCAPRPVPTINAVGRGQAERARAGDDQHRDGGGERVGGRVGRRGRDPEAERRRRRG